MKTSFFLTELDVIEEATGFDEYTKNCKKHWKNLPSELIDKICIAAEKYLQQTLSNFEDSEIEFQHPQELLSLMVPQLMIVPHPPDNQAPIIHIEGSCVWEPEHGMEIIIRANLLLYLGPFIGIDPLDEISMKIPENYAN